MMLQYTNAGLNDLISTIYSYFKKGKCKFKAGLRKKRSNK